MALARALTQDPLDAASRPSIGRVVSISGSKAIVMLENGLLGAADPGKRAEIGSLMRVRTPTTQTIGLVCALSIPIPAHDVGEQEIRILELELIGELPVKDGGAVGAFRRGVTVYPSLGDAVSFASHDDLERVYAAGHPAAIRIGALQLDPSIPAMLRIDDLLAKHFAVLGATGAGKSCAVALILRALLERCPTAHVVLLDPHNEYSASFGDAAERVTPRDLYLPYWLFTFEEILEVLIGDDRSGGRETEILREAIPEAKRLYRSGAKRLRDPRTGLDAAPISVDTPVPYRMSDLVALLDEQMGRLETQRDLSPYKRLKARLEALAADPRYAFMFGRLTVEDAMADVLGRLFRIPVEGKPITTLDLTGVPSEIVNVVVSVMCRMAFDLAVWSDGATPITVICEEAHRYAPHDATLGFEPAKRAIARIAKEGRKYGVSLGIVSQRPSELDPTILSQCNTIFALRMSNDRDQEIVDAAISDTAAGLLEFLPSLGNGEAIAFGEGVMLPSRLRFARLPQDAVPGSANLKISERWRAHGATRAALDDIVLKWRAQKRD